MDFKLFLFFLAILPLSMSTDQPWLPKIVWTYWQDPIQSNDLLLLTFSKRHQQKLQGWEIRHLNKENMWNWLEQIPGLKQLFFGQEFQSQVKAKRADLIRLAIMHHYGGVWMDYTMILTENLDWLLDIHKNPLVENKNGDPSFFILYSSEHGDLDLAFDMETNKKFLLYPTLQVFFIAAKPGTQFAKDWLDYYIKVIKNGYKKYGGDSRNSWLVDYAEQHKYKRGGFEYGIQNYFQCSITASVLLQQKQKQFQKQSVQNSNQVKLAVKYYNVWVMGTGWTAYIIHNMGRFQSKTIINILAQTDIVYLRQTHFYPRYFVKVYHQLLGHLRDYLYTEMTKNAIACPQMYYIAQNSILYRYLLEDVPQFYLNQIQKYSFNRNCEINIDQETKKKQQKQLQIQEIKRHQLEEKQKLLKEEIIDLKNMFNISEDEKQELLDMLKYFYISFIVTIVLLVGIFCICARKCQYKEQQGCQHSKQNKFTDDEPEDRKLCEK